MKKVIIVINVCFCLLSAVICEQYSVEELRNIFEKELCLEGSIYMIKKETTQHKSSGLDNLQNFMYVGKTEHNEKPVLSKLNELAGYNQVEYYFKLESEEGPSHNKLFTVLLTVGKEQYQGQGKSLKIAKQDAATKALETTDYQLPEVKDKSKDIEKLTPTVLLNNIASKLGVVVTYYLVDKDKEEILHSNIILTEKSKSFLHTLNESIYLDKKLRMTKDIDATKGPFRIKLKFDKHFFHTTSHSILSGRHEVASQALAYLVENKNSLDYACLTEGSETECKKNKDQLKSPISKVYEEAQKRKLDIEFEIIKESGLSHKKFFETQCRVGEFVTVGTGSSKKQSKSAAALNMLEKISEMEPVPLEVQAKTYAKHDKKTKRKKKKIIKSKMDEIGMIFDKMGRSVMGVAKTIFGENDEDGENPKHKSTHTEQDSKLESNIKSSQTELLELSNILNFKVAYTDILDKSQHVSLLTLYTNPEYICFGEGETEFLAKNVAAENGLNLLSKIGIYDIFLEETDNSLTRETKEEIRLAMNIVSKRKEEF